MARKRETVKVDAMLLKETEKAWLFIIKDEEYWIPKSQCEWTPHEGAEEDGIVEVNKWFVEKEEIPHD
jgi:hypothetical protein